MILIIDNYDSFTYNLYQYLSELGEKVKVLRNDAFRIDDLEGIAPAGVVISPGPGTPARAGLTEKLIESYAGDFPMLGVCLGHQAIAEVFGARIIKSGKLMHGKCGRIFHDGSTIFSGIESPFIATRYHSLIVERNTLPDCFDITAWSSEDEIMGLSHKRLPLFGVQFHPESIMTIEGKKLLSNFLRTIS